MTTREKVLITGASSGLGAGLALRSAAAGKSLALAARRVDKLDELRAEIATRSPNVSVVTAALDVSDTDAVPVVFDRLIGELGGIDRVIVNAGLGKGAPIGTGKAHANIETLTTNLVGALAQCEAALAHFRAQGHGHLVLIASIAGSRGMPKAQNAYSASKAGLIALGQGLQAELAGTKIKVSIIKPGYIETAINRSVKTKLMVDYDKGVDALYAAIEAEPDSRAVPRWPFAPIDAAFRLLPEPLTRKLI